MAAIHKSRGEENPLPLIFLQSLILLQFRCIDVALTTVVFLNFLAVVFCQKRKGISTVQPVKLFFRRQYSVGEQEYFLRRHIEFVFVGK